MRDAGNLGEGREVCWTEKFRFSTPINTLRPRLGTNKPAGLQGIGSPRSQTTRALRMRVWDAYS
jgi:hypothetical protein